MTDTNANDRPSHQRFAVGSRVRSLVTAQGLEAGRCYMVEMINQMRTFDGTSTTVAVRGDDGVHYVTNPYLALQEVTPEATDELPIPVCPAEPPRFHNRPYAVTAERTFSGHQVLRVVAKNPAGFFGTRLQIAAFVYALASDIARESEQLGAGWTISVDVESATVLIALGANDDAARAEQFAADVVASLS